MNEDPRIAQNAAMRALSDGDRRAAIEAAGNVAGYDRFLQRSRHVQLASEYGRTPPKGGPRHA